MVVFGQKLSYSGKVDLFRKSCCIRTKVVAFGKVVVFGQSGCIRVKVVGLEQKWLYSNKNG